MSGWSWLIPENYLIALECPEKLYPYSRNRGGAYWWPGRPTEILHPRTESSNKPLLRRSKRISNLKDKSKLASKNLYKLDIKQDDFSESVREYSERIKEEVKKYKFNEDREKTVIDATFRWGLKPGLIKEAVYKPSVYFSSIEKMLEVAEDMEEAYNKMITDKPMDNEDVKKMKKNSDNDESESNFETLYRPVHAYDCTCQHCNIIRSSLEKCAIRASGVNGKEKIVYIRRVPLIKGEKKRGKHTVKRTW